MFQSNELTLAALSIFLITIRNRLLALAPRSPSHYRHVWDFYRRSSILIESIENILTFLDLSDYLMDDDVHQIVNRFVGDLGIIQEFLRNCNVLLNRDSPNDHLDSFGQELRNMLEGLYTTLCSVHTCPECVKK